MREKSYAIINGKSNIILSAPHCVLHKRKKEIRPRETKTGVLVKKLSKKCDVYGMYKTKNEYNDANWDRVCEYKKNLSKIIKDKKIKAVIDFHGMAAWRNEDICIGINHGKNIFENKKVVKEMVEAFNKHGFMNVTVDYPFGAKHPFCVSTYVARKNKIPAFQIEINAKYRMSLYPEFERYNDLENSLQEVVEIIKQRIVGWKYEVKFYKRGI